MRARTPAFLFVCVVWGAAAVASNQTPALLDTSEAARRAEEAFKAQPVITGYVATLSRVVQVMEEMKKEIEEETKTDKETYDDLVCWCKKNTLERAELRQQGQEKLIALTAAIEAGMARKGRLFSDVNQYRDEVTDCERAYNEMVAIRTREKEEFDEKDAEMVVSIRQLEGAIYMLAKHHRDQNFLQQGDKGDQSDKMAQMIPQLRKIIHRHSNLLGWLQGTPEKEILLKFIDASPDLLESDLKVAKAYSFMQKSNKNGYIPGQLSDQGFKSYASRSGEIYGILQQMLEDFRKQLVVGRDDEAAKEETYLELKYAKEAELARLRAIFAQKEKDLAECRGKLTQDERDKEDLMFGMDADFLFMNEAAGRCKLADYEYEKRAKMRASELYAVAQAIKILQDDELRDAAAKTFKDYPNDFLQISQTSTSRERAKRARKEKALKMLQDAAKEAPRLNMIAMALKAHPFQQVFEAVEELIQKLLTEDNDDTNLKSFCDREFANNAAMKQQKDTLMSQLIVQLDQLDTEKRLLETRKTALIDEIKQTEINMQSMSKQRQKENVEFQQFVADNIKTIEALNGAHRKLEDFYNEPQPAQYVTDVHSSAEIREGVLKTEANSMTAGIAPAPALKIYENNAKKGNVMALLVHLREDAEAEKTEAESAEQSAENSYANMINDLNNVLKAKQRELVEKVEEIAQNDQALQTAKNSKDVTTDDLALLASTKASLHDQCDYIIKNFDERMTARAAERVALGNVKDILAET